MLEAVLEFISLLDSVGAFHAIYVTLVMAFVSTFISTCLGVCFGLMLEKYRFPCKNLVLRINRTLMGVPPVVIGLLVYFLVMRRGPLGSFELLFTIPGMVIAQVLIITPIITGMVYTVAEKQAPQIRTFAKCMGADDRQTFWLVVRELKTEMYFAVITGFGRSISEVGSVMLVGGNIKESTRTMTTAISLLKSQGIFTEGIFLGVVLLLISFTLQLIVDSFRKEERINENF